MSALRSRVLATRARSPRKPTQAGGFDRLVGGSGPDILIGKAAFDKLIGCAGADKQRQ